MTAGTSLVIGIGNAWRGDDGVGLAVARCVRRRGVPGVLVEEAAVDDLLELETLRTTAAVVLVDAMTCGLEPGSVRRFDAAEPIPVRDPRTTTHALGLARVVELGRALGRLPERLVVIGIEGERFDHGPVLSPAVAAAVAPAADRVLAELAP